MARQTINRFVNICSFFFLLFVAVAVFFHIYIYFVLIFSQYFICKFHLYICMYVFLSLACLCHNFCVAIMVSHWLCAATRSPPLYCQHHVPKLLLFFDVVVVVVLERQCCHNDHKSVLWQRLANLAIVAVRVFSLYGYLLAANIYTHTHTCTCLYLCS